MNKLNPFCGESSIGRLECVSPVFSVAGEFINNDLVDELELLNNFYKFIVPNVLYLASRYIAKNRKLKPRQLFSKESSFMEDTLLPLIVNFKSFNDTPFYLYPAGIWSIINKLGMSFCYANSLIVEKSKALTERLSSEEWGLCVNNIYNNVSCSINFDNIFIFPVDKIGGRLYDSNGFSVSLCSDSNYRFSIFDLPFLHDCISSFCKLPTHLAFSLNKSSTTLSFIFDFSQEGAKALYANATKVHSLFPKEKSYSYNGKSDPFYYPLTC